MSKGNSNIWTLLIYWRDFDTILSDRSNFVALCNGMTNLHGGQKGLNTRHLKSQSNIIQKRGLTVKKIIIFFIILCILAVGLTLATCEAPFNPKSIYEAPTSLGDDWRSFIVKFDGDLYRLPAPVAVFVENGWVIESDYDEMILAQESIENVILIKGNQTMSTTVKNYDDDAQPVSYGFVTRIEFSRLGPMLPIELPGGITENSTIEDVLAIFGMPNASARNVSFEFYNYRKDGAEIIFTINRETREIHSIEITNKPETLN